MSEKEKAICMLNIMIGQIKKAKSDDEFERRTYRAAGASFMLYYLDILSFEEHDAFDQRIFHPWE